MEILKKFKYAFFIALCLFIFMYFYFTYFAYSFFQKQLKVLYSDELYPQEFLNLTELLDDIWNVNDYNKRPNCSGNLSLLKNWTNGNFEDDHANLVKNCSLFKSKWNFPYKPYSEEESEYPLAYVIMGYLEVQQTLRLFRAIYQPQNVYCINYDNKSSMNYQLTMNHLSACFSNVIVPNRHHEIGWCNYTLLAAVMDCLKLLHETNRPWKYAQMISWNDYPLKTNRELVQIMKILNGAVDISLMNPQHHTFYASNSQQHSVFPGGLVLYKSSFSVTMPREFVNFIFDNKVARDLYVWFNTSRCTEEMYFATLAHNIFLKPPGGFPGSCLQFYGGVPSKQFISRYQIWTGPEAELCKGLWSSESCIFGIENVKLLKQQYSIIAHKFHEYFEPAAMYCLDEWHYGKIFAKTNITNEMVKFYSNMQSVRYRNLNEKEKDSFVC